MNDIRALVMSKLQAMWRRRWYGLLATWFVCVAGWIIVSTLPDRYESSARIYVDTETLLRPLLKGIAAQPDIGPQVDIMQRTLLSQPNLQSVIRMTDLELQATTPQRQEQLIDQLNRRIVVKGEGRNRNLFTVSYDGTDPRLTQSVVQALLTIFVESNVGANRTDMEQARRFIETQLAEYERQLKAAEKRLADFQIANMGLLASTGTYTQTVESARHKLAELRSEVEDVKTRRESMRQQLSSVPQTVEVNAGTQVVLGAPGSESASRVVTLERQLDELMMRFTPQHPDVIATKRALEQARQQMQADGGSRAQAGRNTTRALKQSVPNPVYEQLKLRLVAIEGDIESAQRRVVQQEAEVNRLMQLSTKAPAVEAENASLNRDYEVIKKNYEELVNRREAARLAQEVEAKSNKVQFRVVDPPQVPLTPSGPNRLLFMSLVLIAGIGVGVVFTFVIAQLDDTFDNPAQLREASGLPILGSISLVQTPSYRRRKWVHGVSFATFCLALVAAYGGLILMLLRPFSSVS